MIGTHDSYTYLDPEKSIFNKFTKLWKCQDKSLDEQYALGVRYFDVRVYRDYLYWKVCHQAIELRNVKFNSIKELITLFKTNYPKAKIRLLLDKGDSTEFKEELEDIFSNLSKYTNLDFVGVFTNNWIGQRVSWEVLKSSKYTINEDNVYHTPKDIKWYNPVSLYKLISSFNILKSAGHNKPITQEMVDDNKTVYLYDYVQLAYGRNGAMLPSNEKKTTSTKTSTRGGRR